MKKFALTAVGDDKPGIVAAVTKVLFDFQCNIEDSSMTILQNEFAMILLMSTPKDFDEAVLIEELQKVEEETSLAIHLKEIASEPAEERSVSTHLVTVSGYDKPGIVYKTASFLAKWGINIADLETRVVDGEDGHIYIMLMEVSFPVSLDDESIKSSIMTLGESLGVKIDIKAIENNSPL